LQYALRVHPRRGMQPLTLSALPAAFGASLWHRQNLILALPVVGAVLLLVRRVRRSRAQTPNMADLFKQLEQSMGELSDTSESLQPPVVPPPMMPPPPVLKEEVAEVSPSSGFGWLTSRSQTPKVPTLAELLKDSDDCPVQNVGFLNAVASELCVDVPEGCFDDVAGLTRVPASVPKATRTALLHAAVKSEADKIRPKERAELVMSAGNSMVRELIDRAAGMSDNEACIAALDNIIGFVSDTGQLCEELAPYVETGRLTYQGKLRPNKVEDLYGIYLETSAQEVQNASTMMLNSLWGGSEGSDDMELMQARIDQFDKNRQVLSSVLKISESKAEKLMEKKMTQAMFGAS